jgi:hypothetical protein
MLNNDCPICEPREQNKFDRHIHECKTFQDVIWYLLLYRK